MSEYFYYITCPLCQQDVEPTQPDFYRVLPLNCEKMAAFNKRPVCDEYENLTVGDLKVSWGRDVPFIPYMEMAWLLHTRCTSFIDYLSLPKLYLLVDLVSSNVMSNAQLNPPRSQHGAFYAESIQEENSMPEPPMSPVKQLAQGFWGVACALFCCIAPTKDRADSPSSLLLSADIWNLVLQYDIGRLLFIMNTAAQIQRIGIQYRIPNTRFFVEILDLPSSVVQIHLTNIGGRTYISHLSSSTGNHGTQAKDTMCCDITGSKYIAIKNDGIGIVDIAFGARDGQPDWVLHNPTEPFGAELCQIRDANLQSLHIFRDVCFTSTTPD